MRVGRRGGDGQRRLVAAVSTGDHGSAAHAHNAALDGLAYAEQVAGLRVDDHARLAVHNAALDGVVHAELFARARIEEAHGTGGRGGRVRRRLGAGVDTLAHGALERNYLVRLGQVDLARVLVEGGEELARVEGHLEADEHLVAVDA